MIKGVHCPYKKWGGRG